jgi:hypothetical protein
MDTTSRGWKLTRDAREGGQNTRIHRRRQTMTGNDVTTRKDKKYREDEKFTSRGKGSTSAKDDATGSVGVPARKGRTTGHRDQRKKNESIAHRSGRRRDATKPSHRATRGRYDRKEKPGSGTVPENHRNV